MVHWIRQYATDGTPLLTVFNFNSENDKLCGRFDLGTGCYALVVSKFARFVQSIMLLDTTLDVFVCTEWTSSLPLGFYLGRWVADPSAMPCYLDHVKSNCTRLLQTSANAFSGTALSYCPSGRSSVLFQRHQIKCFIDGNYFSEAWQLNSSKSLWRSFLIIAIVFPIESN